MRRWYSLLEIFQFPLKLLLIALAMISISSIFLNSNVSIFWSTSNTTVLLIANLMRSIGNFIVVYFPFFVLVKMLSRKGAQGIQIEVGLIGYFIFLMTTMYFSVQDLSANAYSSSFGLSLQTTRIAGLSGNIQYPLQMGLLGALAVGFLSRFIYQRSRSKAPYGIFAFVDKDSYAVILILCGSFLLGLLFSWLWPLGIRLLYQAFDFIASDINNPMNLFVYGILDRLLSVFNLGGLIRNSFWFSELGGSWIDIAGASYSGDVNIWMAQISRSIFPMGYGRFITPYYILNLFAIPGMLSALYTLFTDKIERKRIQLFFLVALVLSLLSGTLLPLEIFLLITAPLLFVAHILITGCLFGVCQAMNISLGFSFSGNTMAAMPGNLFDLLFYIRNPSAYSTVMGIIGVGVVIFVLYFLMTEFYYLVLAVDLFNTGMTKKKVEGFVLAIGGLDNIKRINSSIFRLTVQVQDPNLINFEHFRRLGANKVLEVKAGYAIQFGSGSTIIKNEVNKRIKENKRKIV